MKRKILFLFLQFLCIGLFAQLPDGSIAPNWTMSDINGNSHNLYSHLTAGRAVVLDFSATWCGPCWNYHNTHALKDFYIAHGPSGDNTARVFYIESECNNNTACLYGPAGCVGPNGGTQGNWVTGTPYPIIDNCSQNGPYQIGYFPTIYLVCPYTKKIYEIGQIGADDIQAQREALCVLDPVTYNVIEVVNAKCNGQANGSIEIEGQGGLGPYTYQWSNSKTTAKITNLAAGSYTCTITDVFGQKKITTPITVTQPSVLVPNVTSVANIQYCGNPGSIFVNTTGGTQPYTFTWSDGFGDQIYSEIYFPGTYKLSVTDANGCKAATNTYNIIMHNIIPVANAGSSKIVTCKDSIVSLSGSSSPTNGVYAYQWTTTNGNIVNGGTTLNPNVNKAGTYKLYIKETNSQCVDSSFVMVSENKVTPNPTVSKSGGINCVDTLVSFTTQNPNCNGCTFLWTATNGGNLTTNNNQQNAAGNKAGDYTLKVTNPTNGCFKDVVNSIPKDTLLPFVDITNSNPQLTCLQPNMNLTANADTGAVYTYLWTASNGGQINGNSNGLSVNVTSAGTYTLKVTNTGSGCINTDAVAVTLDNSLPTLQIAANSGLNCSNTTLTLQGSANNAGANPSYSWTVSNGGNITQGENSLTPTVNGTGSYTLKVTNTENGCSNTLQTTVNGDFVKPTVSIETPSQINCLNASTTLNASVSNGSQFTYNWTASNGGTILSGGNTSNPTVGSGGTYTLVATNTANGCSNTAETQVTEDKTQATVAIQSSGKITCANTQVSLSTNVNSSGTINYQWTASNGGNINGNSNGSSVNVNSSGTYSLTITSSNGCVATNQINVDEDKVAPEATASVNQTITCANTTALTIATSNDIENRSFSWTTTNGNIVSGSDKSSATVDKGGSYSVQVTNNLNGCSTTKSVDVTENKAVPTITPAQVLPLTCVRNAVDVSATASNGTNFVYDWSTVNGSFNGATNGTTITATKVGEYSVKITNSDNGCSNNSTISVVEDKTAPIVSINTPAQITCKNTEITISSTSSSNSTLSWTTQDGGFVSGTTENNVTVNKGGTYTLTAIYTETGCSTINSVTVSENKTAPSIIFEGGEEITCKKPVSTITAQSGNGNFTYNWTSTSGGIIVGGTTSNELQVSSAGIFNVVVTNSENGCESNKNVEVVEAPKPVGIINILSSIACFGDNNGSVKAIAASGKAPYSYQWDNGVTTAQIGGLKAGEYTCVITDDNGCKVTQTVTLNNPAKLDIVVSKVVDATEISKGSIEIIPSGGTGKLSYSWTKNGAAFSTDEDLSNLDQGTYKVTIKDENGCTFVSNDIIVKRLTGVNDVENVTYWSLSPNPTTNDIKVKLNLTKNSDIQVVITDILGKQLLNFDKGNVNALDELIDLSNFASGVYMIRISVDNQSFTERVVKQ